MKNVVCIIARNNSKRLPHKVIRDIGHKTMIEHIIDSMKELKYADKIYLCTSVDEADEVLLDIAIRNGIEAYAGSRESVIDRMLEVAELENADNILRVTGDNIFTDPIILDFVLKEHMERGVDYSRAERLPIGVTGEVMKVSAAKDCYSKIEAEKSEYLAVYMFDPENYKCLTVLPPEKFNLPYQTLTVDTEDDWERTQYIFEKVKHSRIYFGDIHELSKDCEIPYYNMPRENLIKLPDDRTVTYEKFRDMYEERINRSMHLQMGEEYYEARIKERRI